ncbi:two-component system activity regulator YycH [Alicyclobacillus sp. SO9]|uniref:two-component system activity regulator YycH n=1 Tax=Alicyclobacillus sp. SO9 TaxID=2665646 RepID=UPI0018E8CE5C|nr:two-component system activity regulator YycH [Alicyclobacillus sp. SO9]QQE78930.1 hypothetical protein GI364_24390 [Alicyclobacillus sp. SO9]
MLLRRLKTLLLFLLAGLSLLLSYFIWHGSWLGPTEVGFSTSSGRSTDSTTPTLQQVTRPTQVIVSTGKPAQNSVALPGSGEYNRWMTMLSTLSVSNLRLRSNFSPASVARSAVFKFGVTLNRDNVSQFVPSIASTAFTPPTSQIILFQQSSGAHKVQIALLAGPQTYVGTTDIDPSHFTHIIGDEIKTNPWLMLDRSTYTLVPKQSYSVKKYTVSLEQPTLLLLVHSFFVNTQALTRIQENKGRVIWTDGSRAVQWNTHARQLTFEDPNAASGEAGQQGSVSAILNYLTNHGGIPKNSMVKLGENTYQTSFVFQSIFNGLPILNTAQQYRISLDNGHIVTYQRPLINIAGTSHSSTVKTISSSQLTKTLASLNLSLQSVTPQLGYDLKMKGSNTGILEPVYQIYADGELKATIDAVTGLVIKGGANS